MIYRLRTVIQETLKQSCPNVYYYRAAKGAAFPRCVFSLDTFDDENIKYGNLTVDIYDNQDNTEQLEHIADDIRINFEKKLLTTWGITCACYYDRTLVLEADDKALNRRQVQFTLRIYEG